MRRWISAFLVLLLLCGCSTGAGSPLPQGDCTEPVFDAASAQKTVYGHSGTGKYELTAYRFGSGKNILLLTFCIHGWEDGFARDGEALVSLAGAVTDWLGGQKQLPDEFDWSVYVLPCLNPDGLYLGTGCDGEGRCTLVSDDGCPTDLNRCFPYRFTPSTDKRYYNGTEPLSCEEARALADFIATVPGDGKNVSIDVHGWYQQILTTGGKNELYRILRQSFPENEYTSLSEGCGYFSAWCGYVLGFDACLLELPGEIGSMEDYRNSGIEEAFLSALHRILTEYCRRAE